MKDVKISDYLWFQEGPGVRNTQYTTSGVKLINVANLVDGNVDLSTSDRYISEEEAYGKYNHFLADDGDFVIASSGIKIDYFDKKMGFIKKEHLPLCMNTSCIRFKVLDTNNLEIKYFMYYLKSNSFKKQLFNQITGSAQLNFGPSHLKKMTFPLIELKEQKRIIERLDKIQNIINETKSLLSKYDTLIKSRFIEMFGDPVQNPMGWEVKKLGDMCTKISDGVHAKPEYTATGNPFISVVNINSGKLLFDDCKYVSEEAYEKMIKSTHPEKGDILYTKVGATYGIPALVDTDRAFCLYVSVALLKPKSEIVNSQFLTTSMAQPYIKNQADKRIKGIGVPDLHLNQIREFEVLVPPLELQNQFNSFVQQIDKSKFEIWLTLKNCVIMKKRVF